MSARWSTRSTGSAAMSTCCSASSRAAARRPQRPPVPPRPRQAAACPPRSSSRPTSRFADLDIQLRDLTGKIEEMNHKVSQATERLDKLVSDVDFRLSALERGAPAAGAAHGALCRQPPQSPPASSMPPASQAQVPPGQSRVVLVPGPGGQPAARRGARRPAGAEPPRSRCRRARPKRSTSSPMRSCCRPSASRAISGAPKGRSRLSLPPIPTTAWPATPSTGSARPTMCAATTRTRRSRSPRVSRNTRIARRRRTTC